ncbi:peptidase S24-like protein [Chryseobacterium sp. 7]|uniref:S24 family peptidase n=1 Tax=Chryseobacterium sp. 7 TaxID=2035214 RepID=UPI000EB1957B|nr:S24 family peptidase [Chryseobacterium sp. 7]RLJ31403.1 peptidase S24-like protein [Chryseobacterium sp. 7]
MEKNIIEISQRLRRAIAVLKGDMVVKTNQNIIERMQVNKSNFSSAINGNTNYLTEEFVKKFVSAFPGYGFDFDSIWYGLECPALVKKVESEGLEDKYNGFYYPEVRVSAGFGENNIQHHKEPVIVPGVYEELEYINVFGDSMFPKFSSGDIIGIKPIDFSYLVYGHSYVVVLDNGDCYIKYVKKGSDQYHVLLSSENKFYDDMEFPLSRIKSLFIIKALISKQTF